MYNVSLNGGERLPIKTTTSGLQKYLSRFSQTIHDIFINQQTPEKIYEWCNELSIICRNEFSKHDMLYKNEANSALYVNTIRDKIISYVTKRGDTHEYEFIPNYLGVSGIKSDELDKREDIRLIHELKPEKYYSIEHMTIKFPIAKKNIPKLLDNMRPVIREFKNNRLTEIHFGLNYYMLGDKLLIHNPENNDFFYDMIALIKETSFSNDNTMIDPLQVRKLVGACQPFVEKKKKSAILTAITDDNTQGGKVISLKKTS